MGKEIGFVQMLGYRQDGRRVIHQGALQCHARLSGASDVAASSQSRSFFSKIDRYLLMAVDKSDVIVCIQSGIPGPDQVETVACTSKAWCVELELALGDHLWAIFPDKLFHDPSLIEPFLDVVGLVPPARSNWTLGAGLVEVRLVAQLPVCKFAIAQCFASQGDSADEGIIADGAILCQVEAMQERHIGPCRVRVEI